MPKGPLACANVVHPNRGGIVIVFKGRQRKSARAHRAAGGGGGGSLDVGTAGVRRTVEVERRDDRFIDCNARSGLAFHPGEREGARREVASGGAGTGGGGPQRWPGRRLETRRRKERQNVRVGK